MRGGKLRHIVDIQQPVRSADGFGEQVPSWSNFATGLYAQVEPLSGNERMMLMKLGLGNPRTALQRIFRQGRPPAAPASSRIAPAAGVLAGQALAPQDAPAQ